MIRNSSTGMPLTKEQKNQVVEKLKETLDKQKVIFFIDFKKLGAKDFFVLKEKLKEVEAIVYVAKKSLMKIAFDKKKIPIGDFQESKAQAALVFGFGDEILPIKTVYDFSQVHKTPEILGGVYEGAYLGSEKAIELAKLPSKHELLAKLVGSLSSPLSKSVYIFQANIKGLVVALDAIGKSK